MNTAPTNIFVGSLFWCSILYFKEVFYMNENELRLIRMADVELQKVDAEGGLAVVSVHSFRKDQHDSGRSGRG